MRSMSGPSRLTMIPARFRIYLVLTVCGIAVYLLETGINITQVPMSPAFPEGTTEPIYPAQGISRDQSSGRRHERIPDKKVSKYPNKFKQIFLPGYKLPDRVLELLRNVSAQNIEITEGGTEVQIGSRGPDETMYDRRLGLVPITVGRGNTARKMDGEKEKEEHDRDDSTGDDENTTPSPIMTTKMEFNDWNVSFLIQNITHLTDTGRAQDARAALTALLNAALNPLAIFPVVSPKEVNRVMLLTYFRSGSTFMGELLQRNWKSFYDFEPLHFMTNGMRIPAARVPEAADVIHRLFNCEFDKIRPYVWWASKRHNRFLFRWNAFLWSLCRVRPGSCYNIDFVTNTCRRAPIHIMKLARLHMDQLKTSILPAQDHPVKVIHLVRDPRGIWSSRKRLAWCTISECGSVTNLCEEMRNDLKAFRKLRRERPDVIITQVRYEDISLRPEMEAKRLFKKVGIPYSAAVKHYLVSHTHPKKEIQISNGTFLENRALRNPYSTKRDSRSIPFDWRHRLTADEILKAQKECSDVIRDLGYKLLENPGKYQKKNKAGKDNEEQEEDEDIDTLDFMSHMNPFLGEEIIRDPAN